MGKGTASGILLITLLIGMLILAFNMQLVECEPRTWIVDDDGPADFHTIQEAIDATSPGDTIFVCEGTYHENITIDKHDLTVIGEDREKVVISKDSWGYPAIVDIWADNVMVSGFTILGNMTQGIATIGVTGRGTRRGTIMNNKIVSHFIGMNMGSHCNFSYNILIDNSRGIHLWGDETSIIAHNEFHSNYQGIVPYDLYNATILENLFYNNTLGIADLPSSSGANNSLIGNVFALNRWCIAWGTSTFALCGTSVYHNDFVNNTEHVYIPPPSELCAGWKWDSGYPSGGNFWSNYTDVDHYSGPYQNETGGDGIGDTPYIVNAYYADGYPLMNAWMPSPNVAVTSIVPSKTAVGQDYSMFFEVTVENQGGLGTFDLTLYANATLIGDQTVTLGKGTSQTLTFIWDTVGFTKGNYTINAYAWPCSGETETADNYLADGWVTVSMVGDITGPEGWPDGKCDIKDVAMVAKLYGVNCPDPRYDPNCDLTGPTAGVPDCKIDIKDIALVAKHYGEIDL